MLRGGLAGPQQFRCNIPLGEGIDSVVAENGQNAVTL